jgi:hypothetical protein
VKKGVFAMTLTQPPVGSVGWGDAVNANFAALEAFCNALGFVWGSGSLSGGSAQIPGADGKTYVIACYGQTGGAAPSSVLPLYVFYNGSHYLVANNDGSSSDPFTWLAW